MVKNIWEKIFAQLAEQTTVNFIESEFRLCQGEETGVWRKVNCKMLSDTRLLSRLYWTGGRGEVKLNIYQQFYIIQSDVCLSSYIHCSIISTAWPILPGNGNSCYEIEIKVRVCKEEESSKKERNALEVVEQIKVWKTNICVLFRMWADCFNLKGSS